MNTVWASEEEAQARWAQRIAEDVVNDDFEFELRLIALRAEGRNRGGDKHEHALRQLWDGRSIELSTTTDALRAIENLDPGMLGTVGEYIAAVQMLARQGLGG